MRRLALVLALVAAGCSGRRAPADAPSAALVAASDDAVVATVDGRPIYASAVAAQARARGVDARAALSDLLDAEALAGEAARRGLDRDLDVRLDTKGALVRRLLETTFDKEVTPADVPTQWVRREYRRRLPYLSHSLYVDVWHFYVPVAKNATADEKARARARAEALAKRARGMTLEQFKQLATDEKLPNEEVVTARDGWVQRPFSEAAFAQLHQPGDTTSGIIETTYGYHVEHLIRFIPPVHITIDEAEPKLREGLFPAWRKPAFERFVDDAMSRHRIEKHPERLPAEPSPP